jgi:hypothetical protein
MITHFGENIGYFFEKSMLSLSSFLAQKAVHTLSQNCQFFIQLFGEIGRLRLIVGDDETT